MFVDIAGGDAAAAGSTAVLIASQMASADARQKRKDKVEPLANSITWIERFIETSSSLVASWILFLVSETTQPFITILFLVVFVIAWIKIDFFLRIGIELLPTSYFQWAGVMARISNFIAFTLIFLVVNYTIQAVSTAWNAGALNVSETLVAVVIFLVFSYTFVAVYNSWPVEQSKDILFTPAGDIARDGNLQVRNVAGEEVEVPR